MISESNPPAETDAAIVPATLPPVRQDVPELARPPRPFHLPFVAVACWFMPRRFGPKLAATSWLASILGGIIGATLGLGLICLYLLETSSATYGMPGFLTFQVHAPPNEMTPREAARSPFAALVLLAQHGSGTTPAAEGWAIVLAVIVTPSLIALLLMPIVAAGERLSMLYGRCLRLVLWSLTMLIALGAGWYFLWDRVRPFFGQSPKALESPILGQAPPSEPISSVAVYAIAIFCLWWLFVLLQSGRRYAGPANGPAWMPRTPNCARCRYVLTGLPVSSNCPECNLGIGESLARLKVSSNFGRWRAFRLALHAAVGRRNEIGRE